MFFPIILYLLRGDPIFGDFLKADPINGELSKRY